MEKLIELLNEYEDTDNWENGYQARFRESKIISKKFGFIKWLVENDKIDRKKIEKNQTYQLCLGLLIDRGYYVNVLLMLLSISDTPIEDLISYLK